MITKVTFSEVATSRSRVVFGGFRNVAFDPGGKPISCSVFLVSFQILTFQSLLAFREFFPRLSAIFLSGRGNVR